MCRDATVPNPGSITRYRHITENWDMVYMYKLNDCIRNTTAVCNPRQNSGREKVSPRQNSVQKKQNFSDHWEKYSGTAFCLGLNLSQISSALLWAVSDLWMLIITKQSVHTTITWEKNICVNKTNQKRKKNRYWGTFSSVSNKKLLSKNLNKLIFSKLFFVHRSCMIGNCNRGLKILHFPSEWKQILGQ